MNADRSRASRDSTEARQRLLITQARSTDKDVARGQGHLLRTQKGAPNEPYVPVNIDDGFRIQLG